MCGDVVATAGDEDGKVQIANCKLQSGTDEEGRSRTETDPAPRTVDGLGRECEYAVTVSHVAGPTVLPLPSAAGVALGTVTLLVSIYHGPDYGETVRVILAELARSVREMVEDGLA